MIGIIAAMDIEVSGLKALMKNVNAETVCGIEFTEGKIGNVDVITAVCGMGKVFAAMCAQIMIMKYMPSVIINTGVAGTLTDKLHIGDVAIASDLVQHDLDTSAIGNPIGFMPELKIRNIPAEKRAVALLEEGAAAAGVRSVTGTIASGDKFMSDKKEKDGLARDFNGIACEMEGGAIAQVCYVNRVPFGVLRAISDEADGSAAEDFTAFATASAEKTVEILKYFIEKGRII